MSAALFLPALLALATCASPAAAADGPVATFALVIGSNRTAQQRHPPLQYADDDGARYQAILSAVTGPDRTTLLTELDEDSARLFPAQAALARPPTRGNVLAAGRALSSAVATARAAGQATRFYFVFAGHGDVEQGRGLLELADGVLDSEDLAALLREVGAAETHVLLDACNSFFVINPRKPGGRRFATPRDLAERIARRLPGVGVFLSTSAEAEVFEWSELQSGVFSHAVRSGLLGGADADGDGRISYDELAAFVETSSAGIKNPLYRPRVFARSIDGRGDRTFLDLRDLPGATLALRSDGPLRIAVRDTDGLRWADLFAEPGQPLRIWLPPALYGRVELERLRPGPGRPQVEERYRIPASPGVHLAGLESLTALPGSPAPRGAGEIFEELLARPFGPSALASWQRARSGAAEPVFGVSREDEARLGRLLRQLATSERERRLVRGSVSASAGLGVGAFLVAEASDSPASRRGGQVILASGLALAGLGLGAHDLLRTSEGERIERRFAQVIADPAADHAQAVADADAALRGLLVDEQQARVVPLTLGFSLLGAGVTWLAAPNRMSDQPSHDARTATRYAGAFSAAVGFGLVTATLFSDNPTERVIAIWSEEPSTTRRTQISFSPIPGGATLALTGAF